MGGPSDSTAVATTAKAMARARLARRASEAPAFARRRRRRRRKKSPRMEGEEGEEKRRREEEKGRQSKNSFAALESWRKESKRVSSFFPFSPSHRMALKRGGGGEREELFFFCISLEGRSKETPSPSPRKSLPRLERSGDERLAKIERS
jgi:hypothetical protein